MATVTTTTNTNPFQYPGTTLLVKLAGRSKWLILVKGSTADNYLLYVSTDTGASWALLLTVVRTNIVDLGALHWDAGDWVTWAYRTNESSTDRLYFRRLSAISGVPSSGECLVAQAGNGGVAGAAFTGVDVRTVFASASLAYVVVAGGTQIGGSQGVTLFGATIDGLGNLVHNDGIIKGTGQWLFTAAAGRCGVSLDVYHNGDGVTPAWATPDLWVLFGRSQLNLVRLAWTGSGWTGSPGQTVIASATGARDYTSGRFTGQVFNAVYPDPVSTDRVVLLERDAANSTTTVRPQCPAHPTGVIRQAAMAYVPNYSTGDVRVFAVGTSTAVIYFVDWVRASNTWTTWTTTGIAAVIGTNADNWGVKPSSSQDARHMIYAATGTSPFTLSVTTQTLSYAPDIPTWVSPTSGAAWDVAVILPLDWAFTDQDPGDTQSAFAVSKQIGAGALSYWRASDSTWQAGEVQNTSGSTLLNVPAATMAASDAATTFKVKVWDAASTASAYSAGLIVIPSTPVNPAITAPTAAQVLATDHVTMTWTATEQTQFRVLLFITSGAQVYDSGWITDAASRSYLVPYVLANGTNWTLHLQTTNNEGLPSVDQTRQFTVTYVPPMTPTTVATPAPGQGWISVAITNPTPGGGAPAVASQSLYRRIAGSGDLVGVRIGAGLASGATVQDFWAVSGVAYEYRSVVVGVNGTSTSGTFTA